jgi:hypothetical protein
METIERVFGEPIVRGATAAVASGVVTYYTKPSYFFKGDGTARSSWLLTGDRNDESASFLPWWSIPVASGVVVGGISIKFTKKKS